MILQVSVEALLNMVIVMFLIAFLLSVAIEIKNSNALVGNIVSKSILISNNSVNGLLNECTCILR
jgi:hypothetical protein